MSTTKPAWTGLVLNLHLLNETSATKRLSHGTARNSVECGSEYTQLHPRRRPSLRNVQATNVGVGGAPTLYQMHVELKFYPIDRLSCRLFWFSLLTPSIFGTPQPRPRPLLSTLLPNLYPLMTRPLEASASIARLQASAAM
jgi:hypothetical protein